MRKSISCLAPLCMSENLLNLCGLVSAVVTVAVDPDIVAGHFPINGADHPAVIVADEIKVSGVCPSV